MTDVVQARKVGAKTHGSGDGSAGRVRHEPLQQSEQMSDLEGLHLSEAGVLPPPKPARRPWLWAVMGTVTTAAIAAGIAYYVHSLSFESTDDAFIDGHIIPVSSRVAGHVAKVCITDNQQVQEGDLLAELDAADFETRLAAAEAAWQAAQAAGKARTTAVASATAELEQSKADLMAAETREERTKAHWKRIESLVPEHAASQDSLEEAAAVARVARAETAAMREKVNAKQLAIEQAKSAAAAADGSVRQAEAEREQARLNRSYTKLFAPISGYVTAQERRGRGIRSGRSAVAGTGRPGRVGSRQFQGNAVDQNAAGPTRCRDRR